MVVFGLAFTFDVFSGCFNWGRVTFGDVFLVESVFSIVVRLSESCSLSDCMGSVGSSLDVVGAAESREPEDGLSGGNFSGVAVSSI